MRDDPPGRIWAPHPMMSRVVRCPWSTCVCADLIRSILIRSGVRLKWQIPWLAFFPGAGNRDSGL
jgi:hypothetical protein